MTIQPDPRSALAVEARRTTRRTGKARWALPFGVVTLVAAAVVGTQVRQDDEQPVAANAATASDRTDYTHAQVLVQRSIDEALAANHHTNDYTRAQTTIQRYLDEALAANGS